MKRRRPDLYEINMKALGGNKLTKAELNFVCGLTQCPEIEKAITANTILFLAGNSLQNQVALGRLKAIGERGEQNHNEKAEVAMLSALEMIPIEELLAIQSLKNFAHRMAKSKSLFCRINAMRVLRRLGQRGDRLAISALRESVADSDGYVKEGAQTALRLLRESGVDTDT